MVVNDEVERMWEGAVVTCFKNWTPEFSWGLWKHSENLLEVQKMSLVPVEKKDCCRLTFELW
jgi:hypothetical protein